MREDAARKWIVGFAAVTALMMVTVPARAQTLTLLSADYGAPGNRIDVTCRLQSLVEGGYLHFRITNYTLGGDPAPELPKQLRVRAHDYRGRVFDYEFREKEDAELQLTDRGPNCPNSGENNAWRGRLGDDDQQRFDSYYSRWLTYRQRNDQAQVQSMENRMYDVYSHYGIANAVPFEQVASKMAAEGATVGYSDVLILRAEYGIPGSSVDVTNRLRAMVQNSGLSLHVNDSALGGDPAPHRHKMLTLTYSYRGQQRTISAREGDDLNLP